MISLLQKKPADDLPVVIKQNIRRIEKGLRRIGYSRQDALIVCRDLREALEEEKPKSSAGEMIR